jgi:hypothetical protein
MAAAWGTAGAGEAYKRGCREAGREGGRQISAKCFARDLRCGGFWEGANGKASRFVSGPPQRRPRLYAPASAGGAHPAAPARPAAADGPPDVAREAAPRALDTRARPGPAAGPFPGQTGGSRPGARYPPHGGGARGGRPRSARQPPARTRAALAIVGLPRAGARRPRARHVGRHRVRAGSVRAAPAAAAGAPQEGEARARAPQLLRGHPPATAAPRCAAPLPGRRQPGGAGGSGGGLRAGGRAVCRVERAHCVGPRRVDRLAPRCQQVGSPAAAAPTRRRHAPPSLARAARGAGVTLPRTPTPPRPLDLVCRRDYLAQRAYSAVLYLGTQGADFDGGTLRFAAGAPRAVAPAAGRLVAYGATAGDTHCVSPVARGRRETLTLWFTEDPRHAQDPKVGRGGGGAACSGPCGEQAGARGRRAPRPLPKGRPASLVAPITAGGQRGRRRPRRAPRTPPLDPAAPAERAAGARRAALYVGAACQPRRRCRRQ